MLISAAHRLLRDMQQLYTLAARVKCPSVQGAVAFHVYMYKILGARTPYRILKPSIFVLMHLIVRVFTMMQFFWQDDLVNVVQISP